MLAHKAHLATFIHYLMSIGKMEGEMLMLLHIGWFNDRPDREEALAIFEDFLATNAVVTLAGVFFSYTY